MLSIDAFEVLVLTLVFGMGCTVLAFASRSLRDEPYRTRFLVVGSVLVVTTATFVVADDLALLAASWIATSVLTVELLRTGPPVGAADRIRRARWSFLVGDAALVVALVLVAEDLAPGLAGVLLVVAAAARSAVGPFATWLPDSLGAPTVASALLHAGVVGAGGLLLIELAPATAGTLAGAATAVALGAASAVAATIAGRRRADVKGRLVWSTVTQMSFTMVLCGLGLHVAAGLHLVAHGAYKGTLFLGSGGAVAGQVRRQQELAPVVRPALRTLGAGIAVATAMVAIIAITGAEVTADLLVPVALAWVAATLAARTTSLAGVALGAVGFVGMAIALKAVVGDDLTVADPALSAWLVVPVLAAIAAPTLSTASLPAWRPRLLRRPTDPALERS
jgi:NADH:ubiquinone oxidoreductase subunit 5 (subunit L)/multisubunit Na+/H+ antiporter MnhA subunit